MTKIRKATINDLETIQKLNEKLCLKEYKKFDNTINPTFPLLEQGKSYFLERITKNDECVFVALEKGKIIGYLAGGIIEPESYRILKKIAEAENMFVLEEYRGRGIGSRLLEKFFKWCKSKKINRIKVVISSDNSQSINFHKKNGFSDYNVVLEKKI